MKDKKSEEKGPSGEETPVAAAVDTEVSALIMPVLDRLVVEIRRSLDYFTQQGGKKIEAVYITGGGSLLKNLDKLLQERLGVTISVFNPMQDVPGPEVDNPLGMGPALGLSVRELKDLTVMFNLLPQDLLLRQQMASFKKNLIVCGALLGLILGEAVAMMWFHYVAVRKHKDNLEREINSFVINAKTGRPLEINGKKITYKDVVNTVKKLEAEQARLKERFEAISKLQAGKVKWLDVMLYLKNFIPGDIKIQSVKFPAKDKVSLSLVAPTYIRMSEFYERLIGDPFFIMTDVQKNTPPSGQKQPDGGISFSLNLQIDPSKAIVHRRGEDSETENEGESAPAETKKDSGE